MDITLRVPGGISLMVIVEYCNSSKELIFIATEGDGSTEPVDTYLSCFPDIFSCVSVCTVFCNHLIGRYFNACNSI